MGARQVRIEVGRLAEMAPRGLRVAAPARELAKEVMRFRAARVARNRALQLALAEAELAGVEGFLRCEKCYCELAFGRGFLRRARGRSLVAQVENRYLDAKGAVV